MRLQIERRDHEIRVAGGSRHGENLTYWPQAENEALERQRLARPGQPSAGA